MKISKWESLNGVQNDYHCIVINNQFIYLQTFGETIISISKDVKKELIIKTLKVFGFDIEFEEAPKLSKREWHGVNWLSDNWWIARDMFLFAFQSEPIKRETGYVCGRANDDYIRIPRDMFSFITDRAWSVKELRELEHE